MASSRHRCYRCCPCADKSSASTLGELDSLETTWAEQGDDVFFASGYSAREIAQKHARDINGRVFVNNVSRRIKRADLTVPVSYAVARSAVFTVRGPDEHHQGAYRAYWRPLD